MSTLSRYVLGELLKVFAIALSAITGLFVMFGIVNQAVRENLGLTQIVLLLPYVLPEALRFAVPAAILLATCSVYGRFSASNEVVAVKSMGISPISSRKRVPPLASSIFPLLPVARKIGR